MSREANPYSNHAQLSPLEQEVLWEYSKLSDKIKRISNVSRLTAESPNESLLAELRALEKKMGLALTLYKASVWAVVMDQQAEEEEAQRQRARQEQSGSEWSRT